MEAVFGLTMGSAADVKLERRISKASVIAPEPKKPGPPLAGSVSIDFALGSTKSAPFLSSLRTSWASSGPDQYMARPYWAGSVVSGLALCRPLSGPR